MITVLATVDRVGNVEEHSGTNICETKIKRYVTILLSEDENKLSGNERAIFISKKLEYLKKI